MWRQGRSGVWTLRSHLSALLMVSMVLTFALVGSAVLLYGIPRIERESQLALQQDVAEMSSRMEALLGARRMRLELLTTLLERTPANRADAVLDQGVRIGSMFHLVYRVSSRGRVTAVGLPDALRGRRQDLLGSDLSSNSLFLALAQGSGVAWSGRYPSVLTGQITACVAYRVGGGDMLIAEVPFNALLDTVEVAAGERSSSIWVVDHAGEIVADTDHGKDTGKFNVRNWPLMAGVLQGSDGTRIFHFQGGDFRVATAHSGTLGWYFVGHAPVGLANPGVRDLVLAVGATFLGCLAIGLLIAPFWASYLAQPLQQIVGRAAQSLLDGTPQGVWPRGPVAEFNRLSHHLGAMALAMRAREREFLAIFNASPVPMVVADVNNGYRMLDANEAWCRAMGYRREEAVGRTGLELKLFSAQEREAVARGMQGDSTSFDTTLRCRDGACVPFRVFGRRVVLGSDHWLIWASIDIGPMRRLEQDLRDLNHQLEERVRHRTEALGTSNAELLLTVEQLRTAQDELVRAAKMAALGSLVAGVAHELNTPLGNGVMAVSAMAEATQDLKGAMQGGLKRSDLQQLVESMEQGCDIATRNLRRAAELVQNFKQVAVDQTSAQRRSFELGEVVHEMVVSLKPSLGRTPYRIEVLVPESGLRLHSYPGALGQVIGNLIQNAVVHGFEGRAQGTVRITAGQGEAGHLWLRVADDGRGIAAEHIGRIFDPFMTTRMGRGGTGLGLHISYNAVVNLLGGTLTVASTEGQGACFDVRLPVEAPHAPAETGALAATRRLGGIP